MFLVMIVSLLMVSGSCFAFDSYGDPEFVVKFTQARQQELAMQNVAAQKVLHNNELAQGAAYLTSFFGAAYALGGYCVALSCAKSHALRKKSSTCYKVATAAVVLCVGAYAGYQIPTEVWQTTGDVEKAFLAGILAEIGSTCIGAVAGTLSS